MQKVQVHPQGMNQRETNLLNNRIDYLKGQVAMQLRRKKAERDQKHLKRCQDAINRIKKWM
jgi:hypothetical protein